MEDQTTTMLRTATGDGNPPAELKPERPSDSRLFNLSVRAWIALIVILTVCYMSITSIDVKEPLYTLAGLIVGFFFGQSPKPKTQQ